LLLGQRDGSAVELRHLQQRSDHVPIRIAAMPLLVPGMSGIVTG
jgi:hypothetical protein